MTEIALKTQDGRSLKQSLARALRREKFYAILLVAPLLLFVLGSFVLPIGDMLLRSIDNEIVGKTLPRTVVALESWDAASDDLPEEAVFAALYEDLKIAVAARKHSQVGSRLNYEKPGFSSLFRKTGRKIKAMQEGDYSAQFAKAHEDWADIETWRTLQQFSDSSTAGYYLAAVDLTTGLDGIEAKPEGQRIYIKLFIRTILMSVAITFMCILLGYPIAFLLANISNRNANLLMILVLLPFWTSLLVRTSAWKVLLQDYGVINDFLVFLGWVDDASRLALINNLTGTIIAMTHILLPFMILPLYSVMKTISPSFVRAAKSMGATDWTTFWRIYFPNSIPGIGAGSILVFILCIGYYITPELVGGTSGIFIANRIAYHISSSLNWGLAAALGSILLIMVMGLYWAYDRIVGIDNVKLG